MAIQTRFYEILARRKNTGNRITMQALAERCGVKPLTLWRWANGKVNSTSHELLSALCRELECAPGDLLAYVPDVPDKPA